MSATDEEVFCDVDEVLTKLYALKERTKGEWPPRFDLDPAIHSLEQAHVAMYEDLVPKPFLYAVAPMVMLSLYISDKLSVSFSKWLSQEEIEYSGGGGSGSMGMWRYDYYFAEEVSLRRAIQWLRDNGATLCESRGTLRARGREHGDAMRAKSREVRGLVTGEDAP